MRRKDREMDRDFALAVADKCEWATVSVITPEGEPYGVPVSVARDGDCLYFHTAQEGRKVDAFKADPRVWVVCVGDVERAEKAFTTGFESAMFEGECREVEDGDEKVRALRLLCEKYTPNNMSNFDAAVAGSLARTGVFKIRILSASGKAKVLKPHQRAD